MHIVRFEIEKEDNVLKFVLKTHYKLITYGAQIEPNTTLAEILFIRQETGGVVAKLNFLHPKLIFKPTSYNKLVSIFTNKDVWNLFNEKYWGRIECDTVMKNGINAVMNVFKINFKPFHAWRFYNTERKVFEMIPTKIFLKTRKLELIQVPNVRVMHISATSNSLAGIKEISVFNANLYCLWERIVLEKDVYFNVFGNEYVKIDKMKLGNLDWACPNADITEVKFISKENISVTIPTKYILKYIEKSIYVSSGGKTSAYKMTFEND